jgi:hypothetical protein
VRGYIWGCGPKATEIPTPKLTLAGGTLANLHPMTVCNTPSYFLAGVIDHMMEPWPGGSQGFIGSGGGLPAQGEIEPKAAPALEPPRQGRVIVQMSLVHWRSLHLVTWHSGHVSHPHSWGTEIIVNYKGL